MSTVLYHNDPNISANILNKPNAFFISFEKIHSFHFDSISILEKEHYSEWLEYAQVTKNLVSKILKSDKCIASSKYDNKREQIITSNAEMVKSLRKSGFKNYSISNDYVEDEILDDIFTHVIMKTCYIFKHANTAEDGYRLICKCVTNQLIDMTRALKKWKRDFNLKLDAVVRTETDEAITIEIADSNIDIENQVINSISHEDAIHRHIAILIKHPDRLLTYLATVQGCDDHILLMHIRKYGYSRTLDSIIKSLKQNNINIEYLYNTNFIYKKESPTITINDIYSWRHRYKKDITESTTKSMSSIL